MHAMRSLLLFVLLGAAAVHLADAAVKPKPCQDYIDQVATLTAKVKFLNNQVNALKSKACDQKTKGEATKCETSLVKKIADMSTNAELKSVMETTCDTKAKAKPVVYTTCEASLNTKVSDLTKSLSKIQDDACSVKAKKKVYTTCEAALVKTALTAVPKKDLDKCTKDKEACTAGALLTKSQKAACDKALTICDKANDALNTTAIACAANTKKAAADCEADKKKATTACTADTKKAVDAAGVACTKDKVALITACTKDKVALITACTKDTKKAVDAAGVVCTKDKAALVTACTKDKDKAAAACNKANDDCVASTNELKTTVCDDKSTELLTVCEVSLQIELEACRDNSTSATTALNKCESIRPITAGRRRSSLRR